jgi:hypothetical protein
MPQLTPQRAAAGLAAALLTALLAGPSGCAREQGELRLADLTPDERLYVERVIVLERAKAAALLDADRGVALFDSLAVAWGDSSLESTSRLAPREPDRALAVGSLLRRVLGAEQDSLLAWPDRDRLHAPLPDPPPPAPEP